jgi:hypothetical protein
VLGFSPAVPSSIVTTRTRIARTRASSLRAAAVSFSLTAIRASPGGCLLPLRALRAS